MSGPSPVSNSYSPGEWGGIASAIVILLGAVGGAFRWLWLRVEKVRDATRKTRAQGLQEWEDKLIRREATLDALIEQRLDRLESEATASAEKIAALRTAFELVAGALRIADPGNGALARAEQILAAAFPLSATLPPEMTAQLARIDRTKAAEEARRRATGGSE